MDHCLQLGHNLLVPAERQVSVDPPLQSGEPQLLDPPDRLLRERLVGEIGERRSSPERERSTQPFRSDLRRLSFRLRDELRETFEVELVALDAEQVSRRLRLEPLSRGTERLAQL